MNGTGICIGDTSDTNFDSCKIWYMSQSKKEEGLFRNGQIVGIPESKGHSCAEHRYSENAKILIDILIENDVEQVFIEGYSMGSKGKVFNIAESTGAFKMLMYY